MNIQILPNWCKKIGFFLFFIFFLVGGIDDAVDGFKAGIGVESNGQYMSAVEKEDYFEFPNGATFEKSQILKKYIGESFTDLFTALSILSLIIILLSKEKIEDEYIVKLRLQSFQITTLVGLMLCILISVFSLNSKTYLIFIVYLYLFLYFLIFNVKMKLSKTS